VATMTGRAAAPGLTTIAPTTGTWNTIVPVTVNGSNFWWGSTVELVRTGFPTIPGTVYWDGKDRMVATFNLATASNGFYDVLVTNPYDATATLAAAFEVTGGPTPVNDTPQQFVLRPNYPNPFNPMTNIRFELPAQAHVALRVYDVNGALVRTLVNDDRPAGAYTVQWNGRNDAGDPASSGVYFYRIEASGFSDVRKMTLLK
jgi:hypothetical protein